MFNRLCYFNSVHCVQAKNNIPYNYESLKNLKPFKCVPQLTPNIYLKVKLPTNDSLTIYTYSYTYMNAMLLNNRQGLICHKRSPNQTNST